MITVFNKLRHLFCLAAILSLGAVMTGCSDDEILPATEPVETQITPDSEIVELLMMLEQSYGVYVTENTITEDDANAKNDVHNVHYYGHGTDTVIDKKLYKTAYENGHYFLVSERNVNELLKILECDLSVDITEYPTYHPEEYTDSIMEVTHTPINFPENPAEATDEDWANVIYQTDTIKTPVTVEEEIPESVAYILFNKNVQMVVYIPVHNHIPHRTLEAMLDVIYKYQDDTPQSRADKLPASDPVVFTRTRNYYVNYYNGSLSNPSFSRTFSQTITAAYTISGCYSYAANRDYYMLEQEVTMYNNELNPFKGKVENLTSSHDYFVYTGYPDYAQLEAVIGFESKNDLNNPDNQKFTIIKSAPSTTIGSTSVTSGVSFTIGGNVGWSEGGSAGISAGVTIENSRTMNIPDVEVTNYCGSYNNKTDLRYVNWKFDIADPYSHSDYWNNGHCRWAIDDVVKIGQSTATYITSHIWCVENPKENFNPIIAVRTLSSVGFTAGRQDWLGCKATFKSSVYTGGPWDVIKLTVPKRD